MTLSSKRLLIIAAIALSLNSCGPSELERENARRQDDINRALNDAEYGACKVKGKSEAECMPLLDPNRNP